MPDDHALLLRYARSRDAEAFALLVKRYSTLVFSVAQRVTGNAATAEDVTQDCFFSLARHAAAIRGLLPGWLHSVALNRSLQSIRQEARRKRHEAQVLPPADMDCQSNWSQVVPVIDSALAKLPDELRDPLVQHFLLGRTQAQVAKNLHINQSTVSRRLQEGIERLREHLRQTGVVCGVAALTTDLAQNARAAVPAKLSISLAKMAMAGPVTVPAAASTATVASHGLLKSFLVKGALGIMALNSAKTAIVIGAGVLLTATTVAVVSTKEHPSLPGDGEVRQIRKTMSQAEIDAIIPPLPARWAKSVGITPHDLRLADSMRTIYASLPYKARQQVNTRKEYAFHLSDLPKEHADFIRDLVEKDKGCLYPTISKWQGHKQGESVDFSKLTLLFQKQGKHVALRFRYVEGEAKCEANWCPFGLWTGR